MKIVIDDKIPYMQGQVERMGEAVYVPADEITPEVVRDADVLIVRTRTRCNEQLLGGSKVKFVATATIGFDHIDTEYLQRAGIAWANCPGCNAASVAQYMRSVLYILDDEGLINLSSCTIGIVGVGHVGTMVAEVTRNMGLRLLLNDPPLCQTCNAAFVSIEQIAKEADVISYHVPLERSGPYPTFHIADDNFFGSLSRQPIIVNTGRGEVVDNEALLRAMHRGHVKQAVIDTWENEPNVSRELLNEVIIGTPHIAGYSADGKANATRMSLEAIARHFALSYHFDIRPPRLHITPTPGANRHDRALQLYDPREDSKRLKAEPEKFEWFRGHYPVRREVFE